MLKFDRNYKLIVSGKNISLEIKPPIRIVFEILKSAGGGLNSMNLQVYNLNREHRNSLVKDDVVDPTNIINVQLFIGYKNNLSLVFSGTIFKAFISRQGNDILNAIESQDGIAGINTFIAETIKGKEEALNSIVNKMADVENGKITEQSKTIRPIVMVGSANYLLKQHIDPSQNWLIDNGRFYVLKRDQYINGLAPVISEDTGLLNTPQRDQNVVSFDTQYNSAIEFGRLCKLESTTFTELNGIYKIEQITIRGDNYGQDWRQTVICFLQPEFNAL